MRRVWNAWHYSLAGLRAAFAGEDAFRREALLAVLLIPASFVLPVSGVGRALMIASVLLVLIVELLNSAIEAVVDRVSLDRHHLSKRAKDIGSAAVLLALCNVVAVWVCVIAEQRGLGCCIQARRTRARRSAHTGRSRGSTN